MPGPLLHGRGDLAQPPVHLPALPGRRAGVDRRGKQGVGKPDPGTLELHHALAGGRPEGGQAARGRRSRVLPAAGTGELRSRVASLP
jgi:hypothetical protein